jgi:protein phosphatase
MSKVLTPQQAVITFGEQCNKGKVREENQDCVLHVRFALGELFIVADGMGGYQGGATASHMVVEGFHEYLASLPKDYPPDQAIREASARVNASIVAAASAPNSPYRQMGSTVVLALIQQDPTGTQAWIGHVGDSRAYLVRAGQLHRITKDHSAVQALLNRNLITPEEALHHPDASVLTRCLGHKGEVEIDIDPISMELGDSLLLCSDGLWGFVPEQELQMVAADPQLTVETAAQSLLDLALAAGGHDNIGIEMVRLNPSAAATPRSKRLHAGGMEILAICLLAFAAVGASAYFGTRSPWVENWRHLHSLSKTGIPAPAIKLNVAVLRDPNAGSFYLPVPEFLSSGWPISELPLENQASCRSFIGQASKVTILLRKGTGNGTFLSQPSFIDKYKDQIEIRPIESANQGKQLCGQFDVIVFVPNHIQVIPAQASVPAEAKRTPQGKYVKSTPLGKPAATPSDQQKKSEAPAGQQNKGQTNTDQGQKSGGTVKPGTPQKQSDQPKSPVTRPAANASPSGTTTNTGH